MQVKFDQIEVRSDQLGVVQSLADAMSDVMYVHRIASIYGALDVNHGSVVRVKFEEGGGPDIVFKSLGVVL